MSDDLADRVERLERDLRDVAHPGLPPTTRQTVLDHEGRLTVLEGNDLSARVAALEDGRRAQIEFNTATLFWCRKVDALGTWREDVDGAIDGLWRAATVPGGETVAARVDGLTEAVRRLVAVLGDAER